MAATWSARLRGRLAISAPTKCFDRRLKVHEQKTEIR
jgi:hypothetical protein